MGRQRTWDEPELLRVAGAIFRRKGFTRTTVRDIEEATSLHPGSLYKAYGNKDGLFAAAVAAYNEQVVSERIRVHLNDTEPPLEGIRSFLTSTVDTAEKPNLGCLLTSSATDAHELEEPCRRGVVAGLELVEQGFLAALQRAHAAGDIAASVAPDDLAAQLLVLNQGLLVLVKVGMPPGKLALVIDNALGALLPSPSRRTDTL